MFTIEMHSIAPFGKNQAFFKNILEDMFELMVMPALGFEERVDPLTCMLYRLHTRDPQIHLWYYTY